MKPRYPLLTAVALLTALAPSFRPAKAAGQPPPAAVPFRLVPGKGTGRLLLGATPDQIHAILGKPKQTRRGPGGLIEEQWTTTTGDALPTAVVLYRGGKAVQIEVASARFSTAQGVSPKTTFKEIRRRFPRLRVSEYQYEDWVELYYDDPSQGIAFMIGAQDDILPEYHPQSVIIHPAGARVIAHFGGKQTRVIGDKTLK